jgi:hypothetical protein
MPANTHRIQRILRLGQALLQELRTIGGCGRKKPQRLRLKRLRLEIGPFQECGENPHRALCTWFDTYSGRAASHPYEVLSPCERQDFHPIFPAVGPHQALVQAPVGVPISRLSGPFRGFLSGAHFGTYAT